MMNEVGGGKKSTFNPKGYRGLDAIHKLEGCGPQGLGGVRMSVGVECECRLVNNQTMVEGKYQG